MTMPPIQVTLSRQLLAGAAESTWPDAREVEWVMGGAVFGLITAVIQILVRRVVDRVEGKVEGVDRKDNMLTKSAFTIKNKKQAVDLKHSQESLISNTVRQENVEDVNEAPNQKLKLVENVSKKYKSNPINSYISSFN